MEGGELYMPRITAIHLAESGTSDSMKITEVQLDSNIMPVSVNTIISEIENGYYYYYTLASGFTGNVIVSSREGTKYIKTKNDSSEKDNLLSLPKF